MHESVKNDLCKVFLSIQKQIDLIIFHKILYNRSLSYIDKYKISINSIQVRTVCHQQGDLRILSADTSRMGCCICIIQNESRRNFQQYSRLGRIQLTVV